MGGTGRAWRGNADCRRSGRTARDRFRGDRRVRLARHGGWTKDSSGRSHGDLTAARIFGARLPAVITNPTIAYVLLLAGIVRLFVEATHPGVLLPGIVGGICLLVGLYALELLPVNYAGLALMALGIGLLAAETVIPTAGALGVGGVIAFVVGSVMLMNTDAPGYRVNMGIIGGIALSAAVLMALIVRLVLRAPHTRQSM